MLLTKWTNLTKGYLEYQLPLWGNFEFPKLISLKPNWTKTAQTFSKLSEMLILINILKLPNVISSTKLFCVKILKLYKMIEER